MINFLKSRIYRCSLQSSLITFHLITTRFVKPIKGSKDQGVCLRSPPTYYRHGERSSRDSARRRRSRELLLFPSCTKVRVKLLTTSTGLLEYSTDPPNHRELPPTSCPRSVHVYHLTVRVCADIGAGLQSSMMLLWAFAGIPLGVYTIAQNLNVALQVQPQLLTFLSLVTWGQCLYYKKVPLVRFTVQSE